jgi:hypothetical protein
LWVFYVFTDWFSNIYGKRNQGGWDGSDMSFRWERRDMHPRGDGGNAFKSCHLDNRWDGIRLWGWKADATRSGSLPMAAVLNLPVQLQKSQFDVS